ncbi:TatD DNase family protein [Dendrobium catenatum]|uniref:TatD DNase family protein n=1 Tax=Dendrobium catenatum TaxID=906689 RepID=A0A2I0X0G3_9ASPA|nr:TatD DNase family protein [Dendrobium catenatum]
MAAIRMIGKYPPTHSLPKASPFFFPLTNLSPVSNPIAVVQTLVRTSQVSYFSNHRETELVNQALHIMAIRKLQMGCLRGFTTESNTMPATSKLCSRGRGMPALTVSSKTNNILKAIMANLWSACNPNLPLESLELLGIFTGGVVHSFTGSAEDRDRLLSFDNIFLGFLQVAFRSSRRRTIFSLGIARSRGSLRSWERA